MQKEVFMVEFLFDFEDATELRPVGIFSTEAMARTIAFDKAEELKDEEGISSMFITKFELDKDGTMELVEEYYFNN